MKLTNKLIYLFCLSTFLFSANSSATGPRVAPSLFVENKNMMYALQYPPFIDSNTQQHGLLFELINNVFNSEKMEGVINILPSQNMVKYYFSQENALAMIGHDFNLNTIDRKKSLFIPVLVVDEYYFHYQPSFEQGLGWNGNLSSLKGKTYGANKGDDVSAYKKAGITVKYARVTALLKQLQQGKLDIIREPEITLNNLVNRFFPDQSSLFVKQEPKAGVMPMGIVFNTSHTDGKKTAKQFQAGLNKLITSGRYQEILHQHLGEQVNIEHFVKQLKGKY